MSANHEPIDGAQPSRTADAQPLSGPDDEPSRLARAFQAGDRTVLAALYRMVRPLMLTSLARYRERPDAERSSLPVTLERTDLEQESWLILADLAERWRPAGGSFGAYVRVSFPWALARYVRRNSPSRRARGVQILGAERPEIQEQLDSRSGADGREWDGNLAWSELLEPLTERERAVLLLHLVEQQPFTAVAQALQLTRPAAYRLYRRALKQAQSSPIRIGGRKIFLDPASLHASPRAGGLDREGDLLDLVRALHRGARPDRRLPGRSWLIQQTELTEQRLSRLLGLLVEADCIRDRGPRRPGYLVHPSPEATLAALGIRAQVASGS